MTQIKKILDKQGEEVFIRTSTKAVVDANGNTVESRLQALDPIDSVPIIGTLPSVSEAVQGKIYRVPSSNSYADYGFNGTSFIKLAEFEWEGNIKNSINISKTYLSTDIAGANAVKEILLSNYILTNTYNSTNLGSGYYAISVGSTPTNKSGNTWGRMRISVKKGDMVQLATNGGESARAWAFTNAQLIIQDPCAVENLNTTSTAISLEAPVDGWIYINCKSESFEGFEVSVFRNKITIHDTQINTINTTLSNIPSNIGSQVTTIETNFNQLLRKTSYDSTLLEQEGYYNLGSKTIGQTAPDTYTSFNGNKCTKFKVYKGDKVSIEIDCTSAANARAYCLTDLNYKILAIASLNENTVGNPVTLNVNQDGYLLLASKASVVSTFSMIVEKYGVVFADEVKQMLWEMDASVPKYRNNPLPIWKDTLRVLAVGNSYTDDSVSCLNDIANVSGLDPAKFCIVRTWISASSLENWYNAYVNNTSATATTKIAGTLSAATSNNGFRSLLESTEWDIIIFQELSTRSCNTSLFEPYLTKLVAGVRTSCPNKKVVIGWNLIWRYKNGFNSLVPQGKARWAALVEVAKKKIISDNGIDFVIPSGTAIENARNTSLNDTDELTRDGTHLNDMGKYIVGCTWWESIMSPMFNNTILGNSATVTGITTEQRTLAQRCAFNSVMDMWNLTAIDES